MSNPDSDLGILMQPQLEAEKARLAKEEKAMAPPELYWYDTPEGRTRELRRSLVFKLLDDTELLPEDIIEHAQKLEAFITETPS